MIGAVPLIVRGWREPASVTSLTAGEWEQLIAQGHRTATLARLAARLAALGVIARLPERVQSALESALVAARHEARVLRWEARCLHQVLAPVCPDVVLLKGGAYEVAGLDVARGRMSSDVDIMVRRGDLDKVEATLLASGWAHVKLEPYDQLYYRQWTHELPPLQNRERDTIVDVHHAILPITSRLQPDVTRLFACARPLSGDLPGWRILSPEHMVLHAAVHGFHDGELHNPLADILDIHQLVSEFSGQDQGFLARLGGAARDLGVARPLGHALRAANRYFGTPVPSDATAPNDVAARVLDAWIDAAVRLSTGQATAISGTAAAQLLYLRSHWLKMPPGLLVRHTLSRLTRRREPRPRPDLIVRV